MLMSEAWGKMIHEKTWSKKSRDTDPLNKYNKAEQSNKVDGEKCYNSDWFEWQKQTLN